jgi:hypothetical protein
LPKKVHYDRLQWQWMIQIQLLAKYVFKGQFHEIHPRPVHARVHSDIMSFMQAILEDELVPSGAGDRYHCHQAAAVGWGKKSQIHPRRRRHKSLLLVIITVLTVTTTWTSLMRAWSHRNLPRPDREIIKP